jgi:hypothetical protein
MMGAGNRERDAYLQKAFASETSGKNVRERTKAAAAASLKDRAVRPSRSRPHQRDGHQNNNCKHCAALLLRTPGLLFFALVNNARCRSIVAALALAMAGALIK